jgi:ubiquitin carboxyl-terminal hydrolase 10
MPGPHGPPSGPMHQGRRQDHQYYHHMPPQTHSPVHHNPYAQYHHPQHYAPPYGYPQHMQQMPQWNPYHQPQPQPQYVMPPRQFQPHASPVVVSSHPHMPPVNRAMGQTPPIVHSHTPPVQRMHTPQPAPSTPSAHSQTHMSISTPPTNNTVDTPPPVVEAKPAQAAPPTPVQPTTFKPFYPPLPWLSVPGPFPPRAAGRRRRRKAPVAAEEEGLALPSREQAGEDEPTQTTEEAEDGERTPTEEPAESLASTAAVPSDAEVDTPSTSHPPSEADTAHVTTPSAQPPPAQPSVTVTKHARTATIPAIPLIPIKATKPPSATSTTQKSVSQQAPAKNGEEEAGAEAEEIPKASPPKPAAFKSWAELLRAKNAPAPAQPVAAPVSNNVVAPSGPAVPRSNTLADVLASFSVESEKKVSFIEPRGLVNTGNLCYMNSVRLTPTQNIRSANDITDSASPSLLRSFLRLLRSSCEARCA